jgi:hypothetical protein
VTWTTDPNAVGPTWTGFGRTWTNIIFACTQIIGFSQTAQWYRDWEWSQDESSTVYPGFQAIVDNDRWQLKWAPGAGVEEWSDPNFLPWSRGIEVLIAPCVHSPDKPDRVVLTISGDLGNVVNDPQVWADEIDRAITTITMKIDSVRQVLLQPVVGGPNDGVCTIDNQTVRASVNHPFIDQAIDLVVIDHSADVAVAAGFSPTVADCSGFADPLGHLENMAGDTVGRKIGLFYRQFSGL